MYAHAYTDVEFPVEGSQEQERYTYTARGTLCLRGTALKERGTNPTVRGAKIVLR